MKNFDIQWDRIHDEEYVEQVIINWDWETSPLHEAPDEIKNDYKCLYYLVRSIWQNYGERPEKSKILFEDLNQDQKSWMLPIVHMVRSQKEIKEDFVKATIPSELWKNPFFVLMMALIDNRFLVFSDESLLDSEEFRSELIDNVDSKKIFRSARYSGLTRYSLSYCPKAFFSDKRFIERTFPVCIESFEERLLHRIVSIVNQTMEYTSEGPDPGHDGNCYTDFPEAVEMSVRALLLDLGLFDKYDVGWYNDDHSYYASYIQITRKSDGAVFKGDYLYGNNNSNDWYWRPDKAE